VCIATLTSSVVRRACDRHCLDLPVDAASKETSALQQSSPKLGLAGIRVAPAAKKASGQSTLVQLTEQQPLSRALINEAFLRQAVAETSVVFDRTAARAQRSHSCHRLVARDNLPVQHSPVFAKHGPVSRAIHRMPCPKGHTSNALSGPPQRKDRPTLRSHSRKSGKASTLLPSCPRQCSARGDALNSAAFRESAHAIAADLRRHVSMPSYKYPAQPMTGPYTDGLTPVGTAMQAALALQRLNSKVCTFTELLSQPADGVSR
jgi:hypothetical protein